MQRGKRVARARTLAGELDLAADVPLRARVPPTLAGKARRAAAHQAQLAAYLHSGRRLVDAQAGAAAAAEARALDPLHVDLAAFERDVDAGLADADAVGDRQTLAVEADVALEAVENGGIERLVGPRALPARDRRLGGPGHRQPLVEQRAQQFGNGKLVDIEARLDAAPVACGRDRDLPLHLAAGDVERQPLDARACCRRPRT